MAFSVKAVLILSHLLTYSEASWKSLNLTKILSLQLHLQVHWPLLGPA